MHKEDSSSFSNLLSIILLFSGIAGLMYEQIWIRWLSLIFGNTMSAISVTLAAYFLGLALGARFGPGIFSWNPVRAYALWEIFAAIGAVFVVITLTIYKLIYPILYAHLSSNPTVFLLVKLILSLLILFPSTFSLGATIPVLSMALPQTQKGVRTINLWYAANTIGAFIGAGCAGYGFPLLFGISGTYAIGIGLSLLTAGLSFLISFKFIPKIISKLKVKKPVRFSIVMAAFVSGIVGLSLEILFTRLFSQVLPNSIFSFTTILLLFLIGYGIAPLLVNRWLIASKPKRLWILFGMSMAVIWISPYLFFIFTAQLNKFLSTNGVIDYIVQQGKLSLAVFFPAILLIGMGLPAIWSMKWSSEKYSRILFWNLLGGTAGALIAGFGSLHILGLLKGIILCGILAGLIPLLLFPQPKYRAVLIIGAVILTGVLFNRITTFTIFNHGVLNSGKVLALHESNRGIVTIVEKENDRGMYLDNFYYLGGTAAHENEERMGHISLLLHPSPKKIAFLGSATGITAGASMLHPVENITLVELIPEVYDLGKQYFHDYCHGLYSASQVKPAINDARNLLLGEDTRYDVIISDLYVPWHQGTGNLYTAEYFNIIKKRLYPRGIFCQWLPLYQLSKREFLRIAATLQHVFPRVTIWHGDFYSNKPTICLAAQQEPVPLALSTISLKLKRLQEKELSDRVLKTPENFFMLWIGTVQDLELPGNLNHDNWPRIEYRSAFEQMRQKSKFIENTWVQFCYSIQNKSIDNINNFLGPLTEKELAALKTGPDFLALNYALQEKDNKKVAELYSLLINRLPESVYKNMVGIQDVQKQTAALLEKELKDTRKEMQDKIKLLEEQLKTLKKKNR